MSEVLHQSRDGETPRWLITRAPFATCDPWLVLFQKWGRVSKALDQCARWTGNGWDTSRWVPKAPQVPAQLLLQIETRMRKVNHG